MKDVACSFFAAIATIGVVYILAATIVGADTLVPHKYIYVNK